MPLSGLVVHTPPRLLRSSIQRVSKCLHFLRRSCCCCRIGVPVFRSQRVGLPFTPNVHEFTTKAGVSVLKRNKRKISNWIGDRSFEQSYQMSNSVAGSTHTATLTAAASYSSVPSHPPRIQRMAAKHLRKGAHRQPLLLKSTAQEGSNYLLQRCRRDFFVYRSCAHMCHSLRLRSGHTTVVSLPQSIPPSVDCCIYCLHARQVFRKQ